MRFGERPAKNGKILSEDVDQPAVDRSVAGDHTIAGDALFLHPKIT